MDALLPMGLLWLQTTRRLWECVFMTRRSDTTMSIAHYAVGVSFYLFGGLTVAMDGPFQAALVMGELLSGLDWSPLLIAYHPGVVRATL